MKIRIKIIISIIIGLFFILINSKSIYGRISSTDIKNAEPGSTVTITLSTNENIKGAYIELASGGGLSFLGSKKIGNGIGNANGNKVNCIDNGGFTGAIASYTFKIPEGYNKKYTVKFKVEENGIGADNYSIITTKSEPQSKPITPSTPSTPTTPTNPSKPNTPSGGSETINKENVNKSNKIAVEKAVDTTKSNKSSNNYLKNISTSLGTLSPAFNRSQTSYILSFPYDFDYKTLEKISINAVKEDTKEKIEGTGVKEVKVGTNVYNLVVTAENGETRTYAIKLIKPEISEDKNMRLATLKLTYIDESGKTVELPLDKTFNAETFEYSLNVESIVKSIKIDTTLPQGSEGIKVSVSGNEDLQDGENVITITLVNEHDDTENPKKTIYTIKVNKAAAVTAETAIMQPVEKTPEKKVNIKLIIGSILGIILLLIIILIILLIVSKKQAKDNEPDDYGFVSKDDDNYDRDDYEEDSENEYDMNYTENPNQESFDTGYVPDEGFVKNEDIEKAKILGGYESKILNSDFDDTPEFDEEISSSFNDEKKNNRHQKGKRFL